MVTIVYNNNTLTIVIKWINYFEINYELSKNEMDNGIQEFETQERMQYSLGSQSREFIIHIVN